MQGLTANDILNIWERGQDQHPVDRALAILSAGQPDSSWGELVALSIGERDARLLVCRESTLGKRLEAFTRCPECGTQLEFVLSTTDFLSEQSEQADEPEQRLDIQEIEITYRSPNSRDLAAIALCDSVDAAAEVLFRRCIAQAMCQGKEVPVEDLPADVVGAVQECIAANNATAELELDLHCPECSHQWLLLFDIVSFFWEELAARAKHLLGEVHTLARAYAWRESDILSMSARRRRLYLEMVT